jgi:type I restriction enzyme S subunit
MSQAKFEQYDSYKDTGVEWIGEVPAHWRLDRVKHLTNTQSGTTPHSETSSFYEDGTNYWIRTTDLNNGRLWESEYKVTDLAIASCGLKSIPVNSVLVAMYGGMGTIGKNAILQVKATINQSVCAVLPHEKRFNSVYFLYYLHYFRPHWEMFANSARKDPNINQEEIKRLWFINPPLLEQAAIATYLDTKTAQIDRKIDLLSQKATHYGQLKQALINETVTRGLDKTVPLKDSGVEWIGEVPAHWDVQRINNIARQQKIKNIGLREKNLLSLSYGKLKRKNIETTFGLLPESFETYQIVNKGNIIRV